MAPLTLALQNMKTLQNFKEILQPSGFVVIYNRVDWKFHVGFQAAEMEGNKFLYF